MVSSPRARALSAFAQRGPSMHKLYPFARPFLFALDPESAHDLALAGLDRAARFGLAQLAAPALARNTGSR